MTSRALSLAFVLVLLGAPAAAAQVAYVGDSLGVGTVPHLRERLPQLAIDADVESGRHSTEGVASLEALLAPEHEVVVFDLGTNDDPASPETLAADLAEAASLAGQRCLVVATLNRPPLNGVPVDGLNQVVRRFAGATPTARLVGWHRAVARNPNLLFDGVHAIPEGYALRAELFAQRIRGCLTSAAPAPSRSAPAPARPPEPKPARRSRAPDPLRELATELARAAAIGAEFG